VDKYSSFAPVRSDCSSVSIDNGKSVEFWIDRWAGEYAFMSYYHLYRLCTDPHISVYEVIMSEGHVLTFKRTLTCILLLDFNELCNLIRQIILIDRSDQLLWREHLLLIVSQLIMFMSDSCLEASLTPQLICGSPYQYH
jgi:hypothetical protein